MVPHCTRIIQVRPLSMLQVCTLCLQTYDRGPGSRHRIAILRHDALSVLSVCVLYDCISLEEEAASDEEDEYPVSSELAPALQSAQHSTLVPTDLTSAALITGQNSQQRLTEQLQSSSPMLPKLVTFTRPPMVRSTRGVQVGTPSHLQSGSFR